MIGKVSNMSKYTTELRYICEVEAGLSESKGYNQLDTILTAAAPNIFNFSFPIFDESYRLTLEKKILRHFYTREISEETYGLWKLRLEDKLNLIMPYYNKMYESELLEFNPLYDVDYTKEGSSEGSGNKTDVTSNTRTLNTSKRTTGTVEVEGEEGGNTIRTLDTDKTTTGTVAVEGEEGGSTIRTLDTDKDTSYGGDESNTRTLNTNVATDNDSTSGNLRTLNTQSVEDTDTTDDNVHWDLYSDTPQGGINGITADNDSVANNTYLTNARKITDDGEGTKDTTIRETGTIQDAGTGSLEQTVVSTGTILDEHERSLSENTSESGTITDARNLTSEQTTTHNVNEAETGTVTDARNLTNEQTTTHNLNEADSGTIGDSGRLDSEVSNLNEYTERVFGKMHRGKNFSELVMDFRKTFLRIDEAICRELEPLFFGLW